MPFDSIYKKYLKEPTDLDKVNDLINRLSERRVKRMKLYSRNRNSLMTVEAWQIRTYIQSATYRVLDISAGICDSLNHQVPLCSLILTRCLKENAASFYDLCMKLIDHAGNSAEINKIINERLMGGKIAEASIKMPNILNAIDKVNKEYPGFREQYDFLSEFVHPNGLGMFGFYIDMNPNKQLQSVRKGFKRGYVEFDNKFGINENTISLIIYGTIVSLSLFEAIIKGTEEILIPHLENLKSK